MYVVWNGLSYKVLRSLPTKNKINCGHRFLESSKKGVNPRPANLFGRSATGVEFAGMRGEFGCKSFIHLFQEDTADFRYREILCAV